MKPFHVRPLRHVLALILCLTAAVSFAAPSQTLLAPAGLSPDDQFGYSVASSGNLLVVGAPASGFPPTSPGAAYVYQRKAHPGRYEPS